MGSKKVSVILLTLMLCMGTLLPQLVNARGFSGRSYSTRIPHSTYRAPSNNFRVPSSTLHRGSSGIGRGLVSHAAAFGLGALFGSMFHPFSGFYGGGLTSGIPFGFLIDIIGILVIIWLIRKLFAR